MWAALRYGNWTLSKASRAKMVTTESVHFLRRQLTLNVRGPSYLGSTRPISWLLMPRLVSCQEISSHDIDYVEYVGPGITGGRILSTCVINVE